MSAAVPLATDAPPVQATSHRERKKLATRQAIHEAAFDLVDRQGLGSTTVEAISERAGVAPRTFWAYFSSKEDAVLNGDSDWPTMLRDAFLDRPGGEKAVTSLRLVLERFVGEKLVDSDKSIRRHQLIRREPHLMAAVAAHYDEIERALISAVAERLGVDAELDMRPAVLVTAACGACKVAQQRWAELRGRAGFSGLLEEAFGELAEELAPLAGRRAEVDRGGE